MRCMTCHNIATVRDWWKCIPSVVGAVPRLEVGISKTLRKRFARNFLSYGLVLSIPLGLSRDKIWREKLFLGLVQIEINLCTLLSICTKPRKSFSHQILSLNMFPPEKNKKLINSRGPSLAEISKFAWPPDSKIQTQSRRKLSKRGLNMHLKSTVCDWFTIGDRVSEQSRQLQPPHELVRGCQLGQRCHSEVRAIES